MARKRKNNRPAIKTSNKTRTEAAQESTSDGSSHGRLRVIFLGIAGVVAVGLIAYLFHNRERKISDTTTPAAAPIIAAKYVGASTCKSCHEAAYDAWKGSDHALAMQHVNTETVRGNFNNARFTYAGLTSTFFKRDGKFFVNTEGRDGKLTDYEIKYTFGVSPLQQYLIEFPDGRLQALSIAWDSRPKKDGGQRWFHLYPKERITHSDELH